MFLCSISLTVKIFFFKWNFLYFNSSPLPLVLSLGLALAFLLPHIRYLHIELRFYPKPSLPQLKQPQLSQPLLIHQMFQPLTTLVDLHWTLCNMSRLILYSGAQHKGQHFGLLSLRLNRRDHHPGLLVRLFLMQRRILLGFLATMLLCWFMFNLSCHHDPQGFSCKVISSSSVHSLYWLMVLLLSDAGVLHLPLLN